MRSAVLQSAIERVPRSIAAWPSGVLATSLKQVQALPDLTGCERLERIHLETMKGLIDLSALGTAPTLRELLLIDMPQLRWEHLEALQNLPSLRGIRLGTGSKKRNTEYRERLGYPDAAPPRAELLALRRGDVD